VLDPGGAHAYSEDPAASPVVLMRSRDARTAELLVAGYRGTARGQVATVEPTWRGCDEPQLPSGLRTATPSDSPDHPGIAWLGPATRVEIPTPPANPSQAVLAAGQSLQALVEPGQAVTVRSLIKQRRPKAPPMKLVTGDAGCTGLVALLDEQGALLDSDTLTLPGPRCAPMAAMPPADLDGDGRRELVVRAGNGEPGVGVLRAVYHLDLDPPALERVWHSELTPSCPGD